MHENRETSEMPAARKYCRTAGEGHGRTARVYVTEESDSRISGIRLHRGVFGRGWCAFSCSAALSIAVLPACHDWFSVVLALL